MQLPDKSSILLLGHSIGPIGYVFQSFSVNYQDLTAQGSNDFFALQRVEGFGDAGAPHPEHRGQKLVCQFQPVAVDPVMDHQKPSREPFLDFGLTVGQSRVGGLGKEGLDVAKKERSQARKTRHRALKILGMHTPRRACHLHVCFVRRLIITEYKGCSAHSIPANESRFYAAPARHRRDHRRDTVLEEVGVLDRCVRRFQGRPELQIDQLETRLQILDIFL